MKIKFGIPLLISLFIFSCDNNSSKKNKCSDMSSYNKGLQAGKNDKAGSSVTGKRYPCYVVYNEMYSSTNRECFCKGYSDGGK
jgi:hypothetical protein